MQQGHYSKYVHVEMWNGLAFSNGEYETNRSSLHLASNDIFEGNTIALTDVQLMLVNEFISHFINHFITTFIYRKSTQVFQ